MSVGGDSGGNNNSLLEFMCEIEGYVFSTNSQPGDEPDLILDASRRILKKHHPDVFDVQGILVISGLIELVAIKIVEHCDDLASRMGCSSINSNFLQMSIDFIFPTNLAKLSKIEAIKIAARNRASRGGGV